MSRDDADLAIKAGADALGLVGKMPSGGGIIDDETAHILAAITPPPVATVSLTSKTSMDAIAAQVGRVGATMAQIVNHVDPAVLMAVRDRLPSVVKIIQVIHVEGMECLDHIDQYETHADAFLLDSGRPSLSVPELGGTGRAHDWSVSAAFVQRTHRPVFLAGGLSADNVREAIETVRPFGVDVCSRLRTDGRLDGAKLDAFMQEVRAADASATGVT